ncbi:hypothetical protein PsYK624_169290 [Phanerochaete sordida]|uniref:Uncharacterized protein n=1 Tax=Phanerochaete sordida TaxID=48140 RepID=A0A9P3GU24_9APHY|nr:hypothetical protein PsYK624_169290 [Phanerochaete sordida]
MPPSRQTQIEEDETAEQEDFSRQLRDVRQDEEDGVDNSEEGTLGAIDKPSSSAHADPEWREYCGKLQLRIRDLEVENRELKLELQKMKAAIPKSRGKAAKAAQSASKDVVDLTDSIHSCAFITHFCHRPWVDSKAFSSSRPVGFDRTDPRHWDHKKGEYVGDRTKLLVQTAEIFEVLGTDDPLLKYIGKVPYVQIEWEGMLKKQRNYFSTHVKTLLPIYAPEHKKILDLDPALRKIDRDAIALRGSKTEILPPCYYPGGDKTRKAMVFFIVALPCIIRDWMWGSSGDASERAKGSTYLKSVTTTPPAAIAMTLMMIRFRYCSHLQFANAIKDGDFQPEAHFEELKQYLMLIWDMPGIVRLRRWIDGVVFHKKSLDFMELQEEEEADARAVEEARAQELDDLLAAVGSPDAAHGPLPPISGRSSVSRAGPLDSSSTSPAVDEYHGRSKPPSLPAQHARPPARTYPSDTLPSTVRAVSAQVPSRTSSTTASAVARGASSSKNTQPSSSARRPVTASIPAPKIVDTGSDDDLLEQSFADLDLGDQAFDDDHPASSSPDHPVSSGIDEPAPSPAPSRTDQPLRSDSDPSVHSDIDEPAPEKPVKKVVPKRRGKAAGQANMAAASNTAAASTEDPQGSETEVAISKVVKRKAAKADAAQSAAAAQADAAKVAAAAQASAKVAAVAKADEARALAGGRVGKPKASAAPKSKSREAPPTNSPVPASVDEEEAAVTPVPGPARILRNRAGRS